MDRKITNGLIRNGHFVYDFSYREVAKNSTIFKSKKFGIKHANENLIRTIENIQPDLLFLGHSELIQSETLSKIKVLFPKIKIAMWWVDWIFNLKDIATKLEVIDAFFITTDILELKRMKIKEQILQKCHYLPNFCDTSIDTFRAFSNTNYDYDLLFIGRHDKERAKFIDFIKEKLSHIKLGLFGLEKSNIITGVRYLRAIGSTKIAINYSRNNNISLYSSDRIVHLMANGALVFSPRIPNFENIFTDDEIIYFDNHDDFKKKFEYYLKNNDERIAIAKNGWLKVHTIYNEKVIMKNILEKVMVIESE